MDTRVINTLYGREAMEMFVAVAQLCLEVPPEDGPPGVPRVMDDGRLVAQTWGEEPATSGVGVYYRLAEDGMVDFFDCEQCGYLAEGEPTHRFALADLKASVLAWSRGEL